MAGFVRAHLPKPVLCNKARGLCVVHWAEWTGLQAPALLLAALCWHLQWCWKDLALVWRRDS